MSNPTKIMSSKYKRSFYIKLANCLTIIIVLNSGIFQTLAALKNSNYFFLCYA